MEKPEIKRSPVFGYKLKTEDFLVSGGTVRELAISAVRVAAMSDGLTEFGYGMPAHRTVYRSV